MNPIRLRILPALIPVDGREVELRSTVDFIQWRYAPDHNGTYAWQNLLAVAGLVGPMGPKGPAIELRSNGAFIQYRVTDGVSDWVDVVPLTDLQGPAGVPGPGVTAGGSAGQALTKVSDTDFDTQWTTLATAEQGDKADTAVQPDDLATVATSGDYNDLSNRPSIGGDLFDSVSAAIADNNVVMGYAGSGAANILTPGQVIVIAGFRYSVAASGATDAHISTAGGVSLYVIAGENGFVLDAFGAGIGGDDTSAFRKAVDAATLVGNHRVHLTQPEYIISGLIDLSNSDKTIRFTGTGFQNKTSKISANFDGFMFRIGGNAGAYREPYSFENLNMENTHNGSSLGSAGVFDIGYAGRILIRDCYVHAQAIGIKMIEAISLSIETSFIVGDSGSNPNHTFSRGLYGQARNGTINSSRVYGCFIGLDIGGDSWNTYGINIEWCEIPIRTGPIASFINVAPHIETSGIIWTNAATLPDTTTSPWTDNGGEGVGWTGAISFINGLYTAGGTSAPNGIRGPLFVIKPQGGFDARLTIIGNTLNAPEGLATISNSFDRTAPTTVPDGVHIFLQGNTGWTNPSVNPDTYNSWFGLNKNGQIRGLSKLQLTDFAAYLDQGDGTRLAGYTKVLLWSVANLVGVSMDGGSLSPTNDALMVLGNSAHRWNTVYAASGTINTSDANSKQDIRELTEAEGRVALKIKPLIRAFRMRDAVQKKGDGARIHFGVIAQDIELAFASEGLDAERYGLFCRDTWWEVDGRTADEDGAPFTGDSAGAVEMARLGIRYDELWAFLFSAE